MSYEIKAIPTKYNGIQYRSQLEARWGAFFTFFEIEFEYEPFVLKGWLPDFVLRPGKEEYLVEIKPQAEWTNDLINKIYRHSEKNKCLLIHEQIYFYPGDPKVYLGKLFTLDRSKNLVFDDIDFSELCPINFNKDFIARKWKECKNYVQFLKPVTNGKD